MHIATAPIGIVQSDQSRLDELETVIRRNLQAFLEAGAALKEIRDERLYRVKNGGQFSTFEDYCKVVWGFSRPRAYQLVGSYEASLALSTMVDKSDLNERVLRPLTRVRDPEAQRAHFARAMEIAGEECRPVSARHVAAAVRENRPSEISPLIKATDNWNFAPVHYGRIDDENGHGYIPGELYVNCLWYWTKPGDIVVAPMAGSGQVMRVYEDREHWMKPVPWELDIRMFDLNPRGRYAEQIGQHDLRTGLPVERADYIVMDVPYFGMVEGQYSDKPEDLANMDADEWEQAMRDIAAGCSSAQTAGRLCTVISPHYRDISTGRRVMAARVAARAFEAAGYELHDEAFASRRIQQNQGPEMGALTNAARRAKVMLTDISCVMTFRRAGARAAVPVAPALMSC